MTPHQWKVTNFQGYDVYQCDRCGEKYLFKQVLKVMII